MAMDIQALEHRLTLIEQELKAAVRLGERSAEVAQEILAQAKKTNGRVQSLESWKADKEAYERGARDTTRNYKRRDLFVFSLGTGGLALVVPHIIDALWNWAARALHN